MKLKIAPKLGQKKIKRVDLYDLKCSNDAVFSDLIDVISANSDEILTFNLFGVSSLTSVRPLSIQHLALKCENLQEL